MAETCLNVSNLYKKFRKNDATFIEVLEAINFSINKNQIVGLIGPSGCGKSTLLKILTNLETATEGNYSFNNIEFEDRVLIFQDYSRSLFPWLTVEKNILFGLYKNQLSNDLKNIKLNEILCLIGLEDFRNEFPWTLSGGMQQRVALARALISNPKLLFLDEPFGSLDAYTKYEFEDELLKLAKKLGITILMVTHDIDEAVYMCDRVLVMSNRPSTIIADVNIELPSKREQYLTKSSKEFANLRGKLFKMLSTKN